MKRFFLLLALAGGIQAHADDTLESQTDLDSQTTFSETREEAPSMAATNRSISQMTMPNLPTELKFAQLGSSWRRFTVRNDETSAMRMYGASGPQYDQVMDDLGIGVHFTKGDNLTLGKETYLIAYRVDHGLEPQDLQQEIQQRMQAFWGHGEQAPPPRPAGKFSPRASLKLSLLNLRNLGDLQDLRTFDAKSDLLSPKDLRDMSNFNLRRLGQILQQQSSWQPLPLRDVNAMRQALRNQHAPVTLLREPATNETYHLNAAVAGKKINRFGNRKNLVLVYEATPSTDNTRGVLFADWHVERVPEWKWAQVRAVKIQKPSAKEFRVLSAQQMKTVFNYLSSFSRRRTSEQFQFRDSQTVRGWLVNNWGGGVEMYQSPASQKWYLFNTKLSGLVLRDVSNKSQVVAIYEPEVGSDGKRGAIFLDGLVRRVSANNWKRALAVKPQVKSTENGRVAQAGVSWMPSGTRVVLRD